MQQHQAQQLDDERVDERVVDFITRGLSDDEQDDVQQQPQPQPQPKQQQKPNLTWLKGGKQKQDKQYINTPRVAFSVAAQTMYNQSIAPDGSRRPTRLTLCSWDCYVIHDTRAAIYDNLAASLSTDVIAPTDAHNIALLMMLDYTTGGRDSVKCSDAIAWCGGKDVPAYRKDYLGPVRTLPQLMGAILAFTQQTVKLYDKDATTMRKVTERDAAYAIAWSVPICRLDISQVDGGNGEWSLAMYNPSTGIYDCEALVPVASSNSVPRDALTSLISAAVPHATSSYIKEVRRIISEVVPYRTLTTVPYLAPCDNCIVDISDPRGITTHPFSPNYYYIAKAHRYVPNAPVPAPKVRPSDGFTWYAETYLEQTFYNPNASDDENAMRLVLPRQMLAHCIFSHLRTTEAVYLIDGGEGSTGKDTIMGLFRDVAGGERNVATTSLAKLCSGQRFAKEHLVGARLVCMPENDVDVFAASLEDYKSLTTHDTLLVDRKNKVPINVKIYGGIFVAINGLNRMRVSDKTGSFLRRGVVRKLYNQHVGRQRVSEIKDRWLHDDDVVDYYTRVGVEEAWRWYQSGCYDYTVTADDRLELDEFAASNDPVRRFLAEVICSPEGFDDLDVRMARNDNVVPHAHIAGFTWRGLHDLYVAWYKDEVGGDKHGSKNALKASVCGLLTDTANGITSCPFEVRDYKTRNALVQVKGDMLVVSGVASRLDSNFNRQLRASFCAAGETNKSGLMRKNVSDYADFCNVFAPKVGE